MRRIAFHNREVEPKDYGHLATPNERKLLRTPIIGRFMEFHSPKGMRDFNPGDYRDLYRHCFPARDEQSPWVDMVRSIREMNYVDSSRALQKKYGLLRYHDILALSGRHVVAFTSFATAPLGSGEAIVYNIYNGTADREFIRSHYGRDEDFTSRGISRLFYLLRHGLAEEDGKRLGYASSVAGTIFESEFIGQAQAPERIINTRDRLFVHFIMGASALMADTGSGCWITPCLMPKLWADSNPLLWHMLFRPLDPEAVQQDRVSEIDPALARSLVEAYVLNFAYQCEPDELVEYRAEVERRLSAAKKFILVPPHRLPNMAELARSDPMLRMQVERDFGPLEQHERRIRSALG